MDDKDYKGCLRLVAALLENAESKDEEEMLRQKLRPLVDDLEKIDRDHFFNERINHYEHN